MTFNWIATRTQDTGAFHPGGLLCREPFQAVGLDLLPRGSILLETTTRPLTHPVNLLQFKVMEPWPFSLKICLEPSGSVRLMIRQGQRTLETVLQTSLGGKIVTAHIAYIWDAPNRRGRLSVYVPDHGTLWQTDVMAPFPVSLRDVRRLAKDRTTTALDKDVSFVAVADAPCPLGPVPGLSENSAVETPTGPTLIRDIQAGDLVTADGRDPVRVSWVGSMQVPALGRFSPMCLRRPYMGLWEDLIVSMDQRIGLIGSEIEYMFGEERVTTAARHLEIRNCAVPCLSPPPIMTYYQLLLETHELITVNGALVESFDASAVFAHPKALATSVCADIQPAFIPRHLGLAAPVLQGFEALTLTGVTIG